MLLNKEPHRTHMHSHINLFFPIIVKSLAEFLCYICRYGWIPTENDIPDSLREKYKWVSNTSITFMEILHGAYR